MKSWTLGCGLLVLACGGREPVCGYAAPSCAQEAAPDWTVSEVDNNEATHDFPTYDNESCPDQAVIELDVAALNRPEVFLFRQIPHGSFANGEECERSEMHVTVLRRLGTSWEVFDDYTVGGIWADEACYVRGAGKLGPDEINDDNGYPYSWIDLQGVDAVRVLISAEVDCKSLPVQVALVSDR